MNVLLVEDEGPAARRLEALLAEVEPGARVVGRCDGVAATALWLRENPAPDLLLLDVELSDGVSFELFQHVEVNCPVIFTTAYDQYALKAFEVNGVDYLLKPVEAAALRRGLDKLAALRPKALPEPAGRPRPWEALPRPRHRSRFLVERRNELVMLPVGEVAWLQAQLKMTSLVTRDGRSWFLDQPLEAVEAALDPAAFFRINRQFVVAATAIARIDKLPGGRLALLLAPPPPEGSETSVSRARVAEFRAWLDR